MRLIDADYVIEKLTKWEQSTKTKHYVTVSQIKYMFDIIPSVEIVPTVIENSDESKDNYGNVKKCLESEVDDNAL